MKLQLTRRAVPFVILGVLLIAFGVLIPYLGYYWDDWVFVYFFDSRELSELWDFASYYRPISAWFYYITVPLFGDRPFNWQLFALAMRWLTASGIWVVLCKIWPNRWREAAWMALVFAVYPTFSQQAIAVTYSHHYFAYLLFFLSVWSMTRAVEDPRRFWLWTALSLMTQGLHLSLVEYFVVLEMIRPVVLWLLFIKDEPEAKLRAQKVLKIWLPYLAVLTIYVVWRLFIVKYPEEDPNSLAIISALQSGGLSALLDYMQILAQNLLYLLVSSWYNVLQPANINYHSLSGLTAWGAAAAVGTGLWLLMGVREEENSEGLEWNWYKKAVLFGLLAVFLGLVPGWVTGFDALQGRYHDRVTLGAMFGASIFVVSLVVGLVTSRRAQVIILASLVGLGVAYQFRVTNEYRWDWERQMRAYWQIFWRAPGLSEEVSLVTDGALTTYANRFSSGLAVNLLYGQAEQRGGVFLFEYYYNGIFANLGELAEGTKQTGYEIRNQAFLFDLDNVVLFLGPGDDGECIWFLNERDVYYKELPDEIRAVIPYLNLENVLAEATNSNYPPESIFGDAPNHGWCYYFQTADLARQYGEWQQVLDLESDAARESLNTEHGYELLPFLEAHLALEQWDEAGQLIKMIDNLERDRIRGPVCALWFDYLPADQTVESFLAAQTIVENLFACSTWEPRKP